MAAVDRVAHYLRSPPRLSRAQAAAPVPTHFLELAKQLTEVATHRGAVRKLLLSQRPCDDDNFFLADIGHGRAARVASLPQGVPVDRAVEDWRRECDRARVAGAHGIGPQVHDHFVCFAHGDPHGVIVTDAFRCRTLLLSDWRVAASTEEVGRAERMIDAKVDRLSTLLSLGGGASLSPQAEGVLIVHDEELVASDAFILDYGFAKDAMLKKTRRADGDMGMNDDAAVEMVARALMSDGTFGLLYGA